MALESYVLITPARNEEAYIEKTLRSVVAQTVLPAKWVIVSDGSTDRTGIIVKKYAEESDFIKLIRLDSDINRNFASKVHAIKVGTKHLEDLEYDFLGILDADISFEPNYYESILAKFQEKSRLGVAGGVLFDVCGDRMVQRFARPWSVSGGIQFFRRKCYEEIGGYLPLTKGGIDTVAEVMARMHGWEVQSFPDIRGLHHRRTGTAKVNVFMAKFNDGLRGYSNGSHPLFEVFKCIRRIKARPYLIGSLLTMSGFIWGYFRGEKKVLSEEFVTYLRKEQMQRLRSLFFKHMWLLK